MTEEITGGALVARCLATEGVSHVFGLPCPELDPLLASLEEQRIRFVTVRHESAAVFMALGLYKTSGQVAAVVGNPGPGSANLLPGVLNALHEGVPVVVLTAQHRLGLVYPSSSATFQGQDQLDLFRPVVKWGGPILSFERILEVMHLAFRELWAGRPGPIHLEVPGPVLYATGATPHLLAPEQYRGSSPQASETELEGAAELLANAVRPIVIAGSGVDRSDANAALLQVVELLGCPVLTSMAGRAAVPSDHPNFIYGFGAGADSLRKEADVVLAVGTRLGNLDLPYDKYWGPGTGQKLIQIDVEPRSLGVTRPLALGIVADAKGAIEGLLRALRRRSVRGYDAKALAVHREQAQKWWRAQFESVVKWSGAGIHPAHAMQAIGRVFGREAVYTVDGGNTSLWAHWFLPPTQPRSWHGILELGMLGTGIPSAIGAKLALPGRQVVCVTGDGAAGFHFMEMQAAAREGLALTTVVFAEGSWTMEELNERLHWGKTFGTEMGSVRWDVVANGLGCHGSYVDRIEDLEPTLEKARSSGGPAVVCVKTNRDANLAAPLALLGRFMEVYQGPAA
jgi:acetolactate synthase-1/2/3 large subunit